MFKLLVYHQFYQVSFLFLPKSLLILEIIKSINIFFVYFFFSTIFPLLLTLGVDCIGSAQTGSGKTIAFAIPILQALSKDPYGLFALVLTPTR